MIAFSPHREFFSRARKRLTFDVPAGLANPNVIPRHDELDTDPAVIAAIAAIGRSVLGRPCREKHLFRRQQL
jgi:hypothetical protein